MAKPRQRSDAAKAGARILLHGTTSPNPDLLCPHFSFHHTVNGFSPPDCTSGERAALMDALWQRSRMTWTEITVAPHKGLELEKIPQSALKRPFLHQSRLM